MILSWMNWRRWRARDGSEAHRDVRAHQGSAMSGKYLSLYKYLASRYADTVVLTFAAIEDLLGFALPESARLRLDWWTTSDTAAGESGHRQAWIEAKRTAKANLLAQTVVFDRVS